MRRKCRVGQRIRVVSHLLFLGRSYIDELGVITEMRDVCLPPFIIARLDNDEIIGLHPEDFEVVKVAQEVQHEPKAKVTTTQETRAANWRH